ncbi:uncharacterized protein LOC130924338 [Corythoichthys intestinalis]|uniref:uncharacterized protein LOC130924338 n=1 Tax=Corythoichthys intestinalis TaxID=161448 RepID=UPI0025A53D51|nr:uncharacterized protein LOC130924338 [Corythoichthys intestinalis]
MAPVLKRTMKELFVWTNEEIELLLQVTLDYKKTKLKENVDWETCHSKYADITDQFLDQYPKQPKNKDFPHSTDAITKSQVASKVKSTRTKYRHAVTTGRRNGHGRVIMIFFDVCENIWGNSPAACPLDAGIETGEIKGEPMQEKGIKEEVKEVVKEEVQADSHSSPILECSTDSPEIIEISTSVPPAIVRPKLSCHSIDRLKRKQDQEILEDLQIKRRMLKLMEESSRRDADAMEQMITSIAKMSSTIQEGLALMKEVFAQSESSSGGSSVYMCQNSTKPACMCLHNTRTHHNHGQVPLQHECNAVTHNCCCCRR